MIRKAVMAAAVAVSLAFGSAAAYAADIVDTAVKNGNFTTLAAALQAAGLIGTLKGDGPFTVFAPTDEAFAALPDGVVADLLKPENKDKLVKILTYHVVAGEVYSADLAGKLSAPKSVEGSPLWINAWGKTVKVNRANVVIADIATDNGVIHVIDKVLMPLF